MGSKQIVLAEPHPQLYPMKSEIVSIEGENSGGNAANSRHARTPLDRRKPVLITRDRCGEGARSEWTDGGVAGPYGVLRGEVRGRCWDLDFAEGE